MVLTHFLALIPLIVLLIVSLIFYGKGLVHLLTFFYNFVLAWMAAVLQWEILFFPVCAIVAIISVILFGYSMAKGDWL